MRSRVWRTAAVAGAAALVLAGCSGGEEPEPGESNSSVAVPCEPDGVLRIGSVLPQTGSLSFLGPPGVAAITLAVQEINDAGGVLDEPIESSAGDSGDSTTNIAVTTTDQMLQQGADVIIGAASSDVSRTIIDKITEAGVLQISPADTSTDFVNYPDRGLYFRTAPPDQFQGAVLAQVAANDQVSKPAILARHGSYGESLANAFTRSYTGSGGTLAGDTIMFDGDADSFETEVGQLAALAPDGVVLVGHEESTKVVQEMIKQGIGPDKVRLYLVDGNMSNTAFQSLAAGVMEGTKGTIPGANPSDAFRQQLLTVDPDLTDFSFAAEAYDAVNLAALATVAADSDCGKDIASQMQAVSAGGTKCTAFTVCKDLLTAGEDIDYDGQSGPVEFGDNGDPTVAVMGVYVFGADNLYTASEFIGPAQVPPLPGD